MLLANRTWGDAFAAPALLVHGAIDSWTTWLKVGPWLAECGWHVIAVDLRGHGRSQLDAATSDNWLSTMAADLVETVAVVRPDVSGVDVLVGHSLGACVGLVCALEHPSFVRRLVLEDPGGPETTDFAEIADLVPEAIEASRRDPDAEFEKWWLELEYGNRGWGYSADEVRAKIDAVAATDSLYVSEVSKQLQQLPDNIRLAERCELPILALFGRADQGSAMVGDERARFAATLQCGTVVELDAGHDLHQPVFDDFVRHLGDWLVETQPDASDAAPCDSKEGVEVATTARVEADDTVQVPSFAMDFSGFASEQARDAFVTVFNKMIELGRATAELAIDDIARWRHIHVWDGLGHCFYFDADLPESREAETIMVNFFAENLERRPE